MTLLKNVEPRDNPLATAIEINTIIEGNKLTPPESYQINMHIESFTNQKAITAAKIYSTDNENIKIIKFNQYNVFGYKIYYPVQDNFVYLVPYKEDDKYIGGYKDLTESLELEDYTGDFNWRNAASVWIQVVTEGQISSTSKIRNATIFFSAVGNSTQKNTETVDFKVQITSKK